MDTKEKNMSRRSFLKAFGAGAVTATAIMAGCTPKENTVKSGLADENVPTDKMTYRTNLHGDKVSLLGYGCMRLPTEKGVSGREDDKSNIDQERVNQMVDYAIEHGVNFFDTSPAYCQGRSEKSIGIALSRHKREDFFISTKLSNFGDYSREASLEMYRNSFTELQVDYIDYYLLHAVGGGEDAMKVLYDRYFNNGMLDFLIEERKAGRIRNLGFSYHGDIRVYDYLLSLHDKIKWDFVLIQHNYVDWNHAKEVNPGNTNSEYLYGELVKRNIPALVMEPLLGGRLASLSNKSNKRLKEREPEASVASWAFRFAGSQEKILSVISGMTYIEHLKENVKTYSPLKPLNSDEFELLEKIAVAFVNNRLAVPCTACQYCMPCPYGLDIPGIFSHLNKCLDEGNVIQDRKDKRYAEARKAFLIGYDRKVPKLRQANHCIDCGHCLPHCPQRIEIGKEMQRIDRIVEELKIDGADLGQVARLTSLFRLLENGKHSCVVSNREDTRTFGKSGVNDLYDLYKSSDKFLDGALMADKIVGQGAAALMVLGGVKGVRTRVVTKPALEMLKKNDVKVIYDEVVPHVINRNKDGQCPLDSRLNGIDSADKALPVIEQFMKDLKEGKVF